MTRKEALTELLDKVKAGVSTTDDTAKAFINDDPNDNDCVGRSVYAQRACHGSMDAALSLFEAVLPGWTMMVGQNMWHENWTATVRFCDDHDKIHEQFGFSDDTPSRALLIAILEALVVMDE